MLFRVNKNFSKLNRDIYMNMFLISIKKMRGFIYKRSIWENQILDSLNFYGEIMHLQHEILHSRGDTALES